MPTVRAMDKCWPSQAASHASSRNALSRRQAALQALGAYPGGLQLGGGVTTENAVEYLDAGASHVIVTSFVFREGQLDEERLAALVRASPGASRALGC